MPYYVKNKVRLIREELCDKTHKDEIIGFNQKEQIHLTVNYNCYE